MEGLLEDFDLVDVGFKEVWVVVFPQEVGRESVERSVLVKEGARSTV
jgi:hypothetical protein